MIVGNNGIVDAEDGQSEVSGTSSDTDVLRNMGKSRNVTVHT